MSISTNVSVTKEGKTTKTVTEIISDKDYVIPVPLKEDTITKSSTITDLISETKTIENIDETTIKTTITNKTRPNTCFDEDKPDPRVTTINYPYLGLIQLRTVGANKYNPVIPITTLSGRTNGYAGNLKFDSNSILFSSYEDLQMRRKAEYLKYRGVNNPGYKSNDFSNLVSNQSRKIYSSAKLRAIVASNSTISCNNNIVITPPSNAGIKDQKFAGYYLSPLVQFQNYL